MSFQIITDSAANIPTPMIEKMGVAVIPFYYYIDGQEYTCTDTETFDGHAYYDMIRHRTKVNTSQINPQTYAEFMEQFLKQGLDVLYISMSSGISSSFNSAQMGAEMLREQYPERQICLVDTLGASLGEGLAVFKAVEWREQGIVLSEVERRLNLYCKRMYQIFSVDDLMHLKRTGRLSNAAAIVGMVLQIKPLLKGNEKGQIVCIQKERGRKRAIQALAKRYADLAVNPRNEIIGIAHADCEEDAKYLAELLREYAPPRDILTVMYEPVTGSHVGPDTLALFFPGGDDVRSK